MMIPTKSEFLKIQGIEGIGNCASTIYIYSVHKVSNREGIYEGGIPSWTLILCKAYVKISSKNLGNVICLLDQLRIRIF